MRLRLLAAFLPALMVGGDSVAQAPAAPPPALPAPSAPASKPAPPTAPKGGRLTAVELRDRFEKCLKGLKKAQDATEGSDAGRVSLLLQRADELIVEFQAGSGLDTWIAAAAEARAAAASGDFAAARTNLRRARESLRSLSDYTVARPAEVSFRSADAALEERNPHDFEAALLRMEATFLPNFLRDRLAEARAAIARGRAAMVRRDMKAGRKEVDTARVALGRLDYISALSQARYAFIIGAELIRDRATLAARDQIQNGLREITRGLRRAPEADVEGLTTARDQVNTVWRRLSKPLPEDADQVAHASDALETIRQRQR